MNASEQAAQDAVDRAVAAGKVYHDFLQEVFKQPVVTDGHRRREEELWKDYMEKVKSAASLFGREETEERLNGRTEL